MAHHFKICLMGHSFIKRLGLFMDSAPDLKNLRLNSNYEVTVRAKGGLTVNRLSEIQSFTVVPDLCFVQIGGNDVGRITDANIVSDILIFAEHLLSCGVKRVIIGQLLRRRPDVVQPTYNASVININIQLQNKRLQHSLLV